MFTPKNVLIPTDFSHYAHYALRYAIAFARANGGRVHVVHVLDPSLFTIGSGHGVWLTRADQNTLADSLRRHAEERLRHISEMVREADVECEFHIGRGTPAHEIVQLAQELECGVVAMATHGRTGFDHFVFGSVAEHVVRDAPLPVLSIKHPEHECVDPDNGQLQIREVLYPHDFTEYAEAGLAQAVSLCRAAGASLVLVHAGDVPGAFPEFMPDAAASMTAGLEARANEALTRIRNSIPEVPVRTRVAMGVAYREICRLAREEKVDLVVMPTHTRHGLTDAVHRGVAEKVVRLAPCPVLTLRVHALAGADAPAARPAASHAG